jgi:hypothetical protein
VYHLVLPYGGYWGMGMVTSCAYSTLSWRVCTFARSHHMAPSGFTAGFSSGVCVSRMQNCNSGSALCAQIPHLHSAPLACHRASLGAYEEGSWANPLLGYSLSPPPGTQPLPQGTAPLNPGYPIGRSSGTTRQTAQTAPLTI